MTKHFPNLLTFAGLLFGFSELGSVLNGHSELAAGFLLLALLADGLSGQLARRRNHATDLGAELDSLACLIAFGVSVMVLAFECSLKELGALGWIVAVGVAVAVALRLSRDNASNPEWPKYHGLPVPAFGVALGLLAEMRVSPWLVAASALGLSALMLGPLLYPRLSNRNGLQVPLGLLVLGAVFVQQLRPLGLGLALAYAVAGPFFNSKPAKARARR